MALQELTRALEREPNDPYWQLYRLAALVRLGKSVSAHEINVINDWPGPLLALHAGRLSVDEVLSNANGSDQRAEAFFQMGIMALRDNPATARQYFEQVVEDANPSLIEYAAACHELKHCDQSLP